MRISHVRSPANLYRLIEHEQFENKIRNSNRFFLLNCLLQIISDFSVHHKMISIKYATFIGQFEFFIFSLVVFARYILIEASISSTQITLERFNRRIYSSIIVSIEDCKLIPSFLFSNFCETDSLLIDLKS